MPTVNLTARSLAALKPHRHKQIDYWDEALPGFGVRVSAAGRKTFTILYRQNGKVKRFTLGTYPALGLADARDAARIHLTEVLTRGGDPQARKLERRWRTEETFGSLAQHFLERNAARLRPVTLDAWSRIIKVEIIPALGARTPDEIRRADIRACVQKIADRGTPYWANRVYEVIRRVFSWAVEEDLLAASPCVGLKKPAVERPRDRVLTSEEIKRVLAVLDGEGLIGRAVRLLFYTGARRGEVLSMTWSELDLAQGLWRIPAARSKNKEPHVVPLSPAAMDALESLKPASRTSDWVFPSPTDKGPIWSPQKAADRIRRGSGVVFRLHDIRRTVATGLASLGTPPSVVSAVLGHTPPGPAATKVYNLYAPVREMRTALDAWASHLARLARGK